MLCDESSSVGRSTILLKLAVPLQTEAWKILFNEPQCKVSVPEYVHLAAQQNPTTPGFEPVHSLRNCICAGFTKTTMKSLLIVALWWFSTHCRTVYFFLIHPVVSNRNNNIAAHELITYTIYKRKMWIK